MITIDEHQLSWFLSRLMNDYQSLHELYTIRDEKSTSEAFRDAINNEIEKYKQGAVQHEGELTAFIETCESTEPTYMLSQIAEACTSAEVPVSKFESICIYLQGK